MPRFGGGMRGGGMRGGGGGFRGGSFRGGMRGGLPGRHMFQYGPPRHGEHNFGMEQNGDGSFSMFHSPPDSDQWGNHMGTGTIQNMLGMLQQMLGAGGGGGVGAGTRGGMPGMGAGAPLGSAQNPYHDGTMIAQPGSFQPASGGFNTPEAKQGDYPWNWQTPPPEGSAPSGPWEKTAGYTPATQGGTQTATSVAQEPVGGYNPPTQTAWNPAGATSAMNSYFSSLPTTSQTASRASPYYNTGDLG